MKASQKIALEMSTKREALNALLGLDEMSVEQRAEMGTCSLRECRNLRPRRALRSWPKT